jgi:hypothetical protein
MNVFNSGVQNKLKTDKKYFWYEAWSNISIIVIKYVGTLQIGYPAYRHEARQGTRHATTCCHVFHSSGPRLSAKEGSGVIHVSHSSRPHLTAKEGFSAATCPTVLDPAFLLRRAPVLSRDPRL